MELFGALERSVDSLYAWRWVILAATVLAACALAWTAHRRGWIAAAARHPFRTAIVIIVLVAVTVPPGYWALSPLWTRTVLQEASPLDAAAIAPPVVTVPMSGETPTPSPPTPTPPATATPERAPDAPPDGQTPASVPPTATPQPQPTPAPQPTATPAAFEPRITALGMLAGADDFHFASGTVLLIETAPGSFTLRFEGVSIRNGPDLFVYLTADPGGSLDGATKLGGLKATDGSFNYEVPPGLDVSAATSVVVWCDAFAVLFATAPLAPAG